MKLKEFLTKMKTDGKIVLPEFDEYLKTAPDAEIPDSVTKAIEENFMTRERAVADRAVNTEIWGKALYPIDREIEKMTNFIDTVDKDLAKDIRWMVKDLAPGKTVPDTFKQMDKISANLPKLLEKFKAAPIDDEATKKKIAEHEKTIQEFTTKFTNAETEYKEHIKKIQEESENSLHDYKLDTELEKIGNKYKLADVFEETRPAITKVIMSEIRQQNKLKLGEKDGRPYIHVLDDKGQPKFNGNSPVTIESVLEKPYQPFLKKSESDSGGQGNPRTTTVQTNTNPAIRRGASTTVVQKSK